MKRHQSLHGLSSEHHHGLVWARRLKTAGGAEPQQAAGTAADFLEFWEKDLQAHFRKEEDVLFPYYYRCRQRTTENMLETLRQHVVIRGEILTLQEEMENNAINPQRLAAIGELLNEHVRFEERELFEEIQENCPEALLKKIGEIEEMRKPSRP